MNCTIVKKIETYPYDFTFKTNKNGYKMVTVEYPGEWGASSGWHDNFDVALADAAAECGELTKDLWDILFTIHYHNIAEDRSKFDDAFRFFAKLKK